MPLAVNTILLGLAIVPTWIAVREHAPIEAARGGSEELEKMSGEGGEEAVVLGSEKVEGDEVGKLALVQSIVPAR